MKTDGQVSYNADGSVLVTNYKKAVILISAATNFVNYTDVSGDGAAKSLSMLTHAAATDYKALLEHHVKAYQEQYRRVCLHLASSEHCQLTTEKRVEQFAVCAFILHYGHAQ